MKDLTHSIVFLQTTLECDLIINECRYHFAYRTLMLESSTYVVIDFHNLQNQIICCQCLTTRGWCIYYLKSKMTKSKMKSWWYLLLMNLIFCLIRTSCLYNDPNNLKYFNCTLIVGLFYHIHPTITCVTFILDIFHSRFKYHIWK